MTGDDAARVLDACRTLDEGFHQVAKGGKYRHDDTQANPGRQVRHLEELIKPVERGIGPCNACHHAADDALPRLLGRDALKQAVLSKQHPEAIGARVIEPDEHEHAQQQTRSGDAHDAVQHRYRLRHIDQRHEGALQAVKGILLGTVELNDTTQNHIDGNGQ